MTACKIVDESVAIFDAMVKDKLKVHCRASSHLLRSAASSRFSLNARALPTVGLPFIPSSRKMTSIRCSCSFGFHQLSAV